MNSVNTQIRVDVRNLRRKTTTLQPMQLCAYSVQLLGVPADIVGVFMVVFTPTNEHFAAFPLSQDDNGDWTAELLPTHFPTAGRAKYELFGESPSGQRVALGVGESEITPFDSGSTPIPHGRKITIAEIPASDGTMHKIKAVDVGKGGKHIWTSEVEV